MQPPISPLLYTALLFFGMLILSEAGRLIGVRQLPKESKEERGSLATIEGAVFALFGLLMAFTFSGAAMRFNEKRMLISEEVNAVEITYFRLQLLPEEARPSLQESVRQYVDSRLEIYRRLPNMQAAKVEMARARKLQDEIWTRAVAAVRLPGAHPSAAWLLLPAINNMIDVSTTRTMALQMHPPRVIYFLLFSLGLLCSLLAGYRMAGGRQRSWLHTLGFIVITIIIVYVMLDVEYPRGGLIHLEEADQLLVEARAHMR